MSIAAFADPNDLKKILDKAKIQLATKREVVSISSAVTDLQNAFGHAVTYITNINKLKNSAIKNELRNHKALLQKKLSQANIESNTNAALLSAMNSVASSTDGLVIANKESASSTSSTIKDVFLMIATRGRLGSLGKLGKGLGLGALALDAGSRFMDGESAGDIAMGVGGGALGMAGGSLLGARIGALGGPIGAGIGAAIGGAAGYFAGSKAGDATSGYLKQRDSAVAGSSDYGKKFADFISGSVKNISTFIALSPLGLAMTAANAVYNAGSDFVEGLSEGWNGERPAEGNVASKQAMDYFMSQNWSKEQAAGLVGNLQVESGNFSPDVVSGRRRGDSGRAVGIGQWHPDRQANFARLFGRSILGSSLMQQLQFVQHELTGSERSAGNKLRTAKTAKEAAIIVDKFYERSSGAARGQRIANAEALAGNQGFFRTAGGYVGAGTRYVYDKGKGAVQAAGEYITGAYGRLRDAIGILFRLGFGITGNERNLANLHPEFEKRIVAALTDYKGMTGRIPTLTSGFRYPGDQSRINSGSNPKAASGKSRHEIGQALDFSPADVGLMNRLGILQRYGLIGGKASSARGGYVNDPPHIELAGPRLSPPSANQLYTQSAQNTTGRKRLSRPRVPWPTNSFSYPFMAQPGAKPKRGNGSMLMTNPKPQYTWYFGS